MVPRSASGVPDDFPAPGEGRHEAPPPKPLLAPNAGKSLVIDLDGRRFARIPLQTEAFTGGEAFAEVIAGYVDRAVRAIVDDPELAAGLGQDWFVVVGEKIVAIAQGRSVFWWDIEPGRAARLLSRFVLRTPTGVGLSTPWTMQMAIDEAGLPRILLAAAASAVGKLVGRRGWFYRVAGHDVNAIDGPGGKVVYPGNASVKLPPRRPDEAAAEIRRALSDAVPAEPAARLAGVVIIDANDLGRNVLGRSSERPASFFESMFIDNPAGQDRQQTPIMVCLEV